jgi:hypothetical protein
MRRNNGEGKVAVGEARLKLKPVCEIALLRVALRGSIQGHAD